MPITRDGWIDWGVRDPGPPDKRYSEPCASAGLVFHSAVGYYHGWRARLFDMSRLANGRYTPYAAASVTGFILYDGTLMQHYPIQVSCWASGNWHANTAFNGIEVEGGYAPVTEVWRPAQLDTAVRLTVEVARVRGWEPRHEDDANDTLLRHSQCVRLWGGSPTACDSGRAPHGVIVARANALISPPPPPSIEEDDGMKVYGIRLPSGYYVYISNGAERRYVFNGTTLRKRQQIGVLPSRVIALTGGDVDEFMRIPEGPSVL